MLEGPVLGRLLEPNIPFHLQNFNNKFAVKFKGEVRLNFFFQSCVVFAIPAILVSEVSDQDRLAIKSESTDLASS